MNTQNQQLNSKAEALAWFQTLPASEQLVLIRQATAEAQRAVKQATTLIGGGSPLLGETYAQRHLNYAPMQEAQPCY